MRRSIEDFNLRYLEAEQDARETKNSLLRVVAKCEFSIFAAEVNLIEAVYRLAQRCQSDPSREKLEELQQAFKRLLERINTRSAQQLIGRAAPEQNINTFIPCCRHHYGG